MYIQPFRQRVLIIYHHIHVRHYSQNILTGFFLQDIETRIKYSLISAEFVDDKPLYTRLLLLFKQRYGSVELRKYSAPVDITYQQNRRIRKLRHAHIYDIIVPKVYLRGTSGSLYYDYVILRSQLFIGFFHNRYESFFMPVILPCSHVAADFSVDDDLGTDISCRLQKYGVHQHRWLNAGCLRLNHLGSAHLEAFIGYEAVKSHILGFKGRNFVPVLPEDTAKSCRNETFSCIGHGPLYHDRFSFFLLFQNPLPFQIFNLRLPVFSCCIGIPVSHHTASAI